MKDMVQMTTSEFVAYVEAERKAAVLAEREACAKVCEEFGEWRDTSGVDCAAAIRARGE